MLFATQTDIRIANIMKPPKVNSLIKVCDFLIIPIFAQYKFACILLLDKFLLNRLYFLTLTQSLLRYTHDMKQADEISSLTGWMDAGRGEGCTRVAKSGSRACFSHSIFIYLDLKGGFLVQLYFFWVFFLTIFSLKTPL